jgi:hypothetical protein
MKLKKGDRVRFEVHGENKGTGRITRVVESGICLVKVDPPHTWAKPYDIQFLETELELEINGLNMVFSWLEET